MRSTLLIVFVAGAGIAAAPIALRTSSVVRAADTVQGPVGNITNLRDMSQLMKDPEYREQKRTEISSQLAESGAEVANEVGLTTSQLRELIDLETGYHMGVLDTFVPEVREYAQTRRQRKQLLQNSGSSKVSWMQNLLRFWVPKRRSCLRSM